jgi:hypothetical protein
LIVYVDRKGLEKQLQRYISTAVRERSYVSVLSGDPDEDRRMLSRRNCPAFEVRDARRLAEEGVRFQSTFEAILEEERKKYKSSGSKRWTWIGIWEHCFYEHFDPVLGAERIADANSVTPTICCFDNKGFCSLPLAQLLELFKLHNEVVFPVVRAR